MVTVIASLVLSSSFGPINQAFEPNKGTAYSISPKAPIVDDGVLTLLDGKPNENKWIYFEPMSAKAPKKVEMSWKASIKEGGEGYCVVLAPAGQELKEENWDEPNLPGTLAIAFDVRNPRSSNYFNAEGNIYGRPEREVSIHWDGTEIANRLSPVEFRSDSLSNYELTIEYVTGGAEITLAINKTKVYDKFFLPEASPFPFKTAFGGRTSDSVTTLKLDDIKAKQSDLKKPFDKPIVVTAFDKVLNDKERHRNTNEVEFPEMKGIGRVVMTLTLAPTPAGLDPWDRCAAIYLFDDKGERFEVQRYITPYRRAYTWKTDVTDFLPLFKGKKKMEQFCETYSAGWLVSVTLSFYPGPSATTPIKIENLWCGSAELGNPKNPSEKFFVPKKIKPDSKGSAWRVRFSVTGHGQYPNTDNAGEFFALNRTLTVNGTEFVNQLWKDDNYLNPCRPQGGTWKFDRAGWAPGDVVTPWIVDISKLVVSGQPIDIRYQIALFKNEHVVEGDPARHWFESQIVTYRKR